ncbi:hypothetical protein EDB80DRAFT_730874 [Ilyonectria destructans]|nr:hypothetical protein EDB80DRAFT_730874 [Ilyonectria destructans]
MWLIHYRININGVLCTPTLRDAKAHFKIPNQTIHGWKQAFSESYIEDKSRGFAPQWPELEGRLFSPKGVFQPEDYNR